MWHRIRDMFNPATRRTTPGPTCDDPIVAAVTRQVRALRGPARTTRAAVAQALVEHTGLSDLIVERDLSAAAPDTAFARLRWGGQIAFVSPSARAVDSLMTDFRAREEFRIEQSPQPVYEPLGSALRHLRRRRHLYFVARKVMLEKTGDLTVRHSHDVRLEPDSTALACDGYVVSKRVPSLEQTAERLLKMRPSLSDDEACALADKLVNKVFPIFLTREAAFLKLLRTRLPGHLQQRVPGFVRMEQDSRGLVRRLDMSWMRLGCRSISLLDFARQAATVLHALHHHAGMLHLDLRLENLVITDQGVCAIDFGSSVLAGEDLAQSKLLHTLHTEMLNASRPAAQLRRMQGAGVVTSGLFQQCYAQRSPAIDLFCLAWFMTRPHAQPDFRPLVRMGHDDADAQRLQRLQRLVLAPSDPQRPIIRGVRDLLDMLNGTWAPPAEISRHALSPSTDASGFISGHDSGEYDDLVTVSHAAA